MVEGATIADGDQNRSLGPFMGDMDDCTQWKSPVRARHISGAHTFAVTGRAT